MSKESPAKLPGNANQTPHQRQNQTLTSGAQNDLSKQTFSNPVTQPNGKSPTKSVTNNDANTTPVKSATSPPTKSTPTKSKNKKKNDAKRRSANMKKQQQSQQRSPSKSDKMKPDTEPADCDSLQNQQQHKDIQQERLSSQNPSPPPSKVTNKQPQGCHLEQMASEDNIQSQSNRTTTAVELSPGVSCESHEKQSPGNTNLNGTSNEFGAHRSNSDTNSWRRKQQRENRELREQLKLRDAQLSNLADRVKQQINKTKDLEASLVNTTRTCSQFEKLLQQELTNRTRLETENDGLNQTINRLRAQIVVHEKERSANNELIRVLNATLMERETEVSILKLKMTRMQTNSTVNMAQFNPPSNPSLVRNSDPCKAYTTAGRSNSEFTRNSTTRSTMLADAISNRASTSQLADQKTDDSDALVWANVPEELTPSKRPLLLERNLNQLYEKSHNVSGGLASPSRSKTSTPILRDRRYRTLPRSMKNPIQQQEDCDSNQTLEKPSKPTPAVESSNAIPAKQQSVHCLVTNLDESNTSRSSGNKSSTDAGSSQGNESTPSAEKEVTGLPRSSLSDDSKTPRQDHNFTPHEIRISREHETSSHYTAIGDTNRSSLAQVDPIEFTLEKTKTPPHLAPKVPSSPLKISAGIKKIFGKFKRSDSSSNESSSRSELRSNIDSPMATAFQRGATRSTLIGPPSSFRAQMSATKAANFPTDKPFADWDTNMLVDWLTMIGLSMYANQCRRWVECGAHIMNATPTEVDKGLGITNHLHRKKLRLAISELNGDCDKITKAASKLDYLWVARWLDDIGLPQYKEAFIEARVDGRVLNYLTVEDLVSMNVRSLLHHASIRCGIRVLRSINFDLQLLKRRATAEEIEQMNSIRASMDVQSDNSATTKMDADAQQVKTHDESEVPLWTCHRVMEWLRMIDFAEFAPNLRGSGVHGGLIMYEDGFNIDTMSTLLSIPSGRTLLRRHLSTFFDNLIGKELVQRKRQFKEIPANQQLNPASEIKNPKKSSLWFNKLKSSKVGQDGMDEYLCPMYPVEPQIIKSPTRKSELSRREGSNLPRIPESINV